MAVTTVIGSIIKYIDAENQTIIRPKTTDSAVSVDRGSNANVPSSATDLNKLVAALGSLAFKSGIAEATTSVAGLMSAADKAKLNGIAENANNYTHPNSGVSAGTYTSVTVNAQGHITAGTKPTTLAGYGITDAASKQHQHESADIVSLDASKITGVIDISHIPQGALERVVPVADDGARLKLTTGEVQKGDVVKVESTGLMYFVVDDTKLSTEAGYMPFTAGAATSVPWSGVTGKPSTFTPSAHNQDISTINGLQAALNGKAADQVMGGASASAAGTKGLVPAPSTGAANRYLRSDGTWAVPPDNNTTYTNMVGASSSAAGKAGLVPAPAAGKQAQYLRGDGTWATPTDTKYNNATTSVAGLMSAADKTKLDGIATGANKYVHPTTSGNKHIPTGGAAGQILRWSADGTAVWGDDEDTTYTVFRGASASAAGGTGLVPAPAQNQQTRFLRADGTWQTPTNTTYNVFSGANGSAGGTNGLVPAPGAADNHDLLCGDGTWKAMSETMVVANAAPAYSCIWIQTEA